MKSPVGLSTEFSSRARAVRCVEVVTRDGESMRGFALGVLSCLAIIAGIGFYVLARPYFL